MIYRVYALGFRPRGGAGATCGCTVPHGQRVSRREAWLAAGCLARTFVGTVFANALSWGVASIVFALGFRTVLFSLLQPRARGGLHNKCKHTGVCLFLLLFFCCFEVKRGAVLEDGLTPRNECNRPMVGQTRITRSVSRYVGVLPVR